MQESSSGCVSELAICNYCGVVLNAWAANLFPLVSLMSVAHENERSALSARNETAREAQPSDRLE